ncbi:phage tail assembly protein [Clostridium chromiireducens]|uniref:Phage tail assembly protein n=1 Tax=Clostridium chromiireducens TaxID=225345 RepID=A0A399IIX2_9CLOT|nr:phage tail assembly protein [Clostridium chromiireducens]RII32851.1 phage tail assembly protein [Clostridium chromiireducens]
MNEFEKLPLTKPIKINGEECKEIPYDLENFTARDKMKAGVKYKKDGGVASVPDLDSDYHLYLFAEAASKANSNIDINDVLRMSAKDATKASNIVRSFFFIDSEESQDNTQMNSSEEQ